MAVNSLRLRDQSICNDIQQVKKRSTEIWELEMETGKAK